MHPRSSSLLEPLLSILFELLAVAKVSYEIIFTKSKQNAGNLFSFSASLMRNNAAMIEYKLFPISKLNLTAQLAVHCAFSNFNR